MQALGKEGFMARSAVVEWPLDNFVICLEVYPDLTREGDDSICASNFL